MQSFPLHRVNDDRSKLAFANGQSILVERKAYDAAGGHAAVRDRFVEDIGMAAKVKALGLPIRTVLVRNLVTCRMYASLGQLIRGWSRILYDALDRKPWRLAVRLLDPLIFCQSGHVALAGRDRHARAGSAGSVRLVAARHEPRSSRADVPGLPPRLPHFGPRFKVRPLVPAGQPPHRLHPAPPIKMCLTGHVTWRGTSYGVETPSKRIDQRQLDRRNHRGATLHATLALTKVRASPRSER